MRNLTAILILGALLAPTTLTAQGPGPRGRAVAPHRMQDRAPRMGAQGLGAAQGVFAPEMLIQRRERLSLTDEQVKQLEALASESREAREQAAAATKPHAEKLRELWQADQPDVNAMQSAMRALMEAQHAAGIVAMTGTATAKGLLTAEQRGRVEGWADARGMAGRGFNRGQGWNRGPSRGAGYHMQPQRRRF